MVAARGSRYAMFQTTAEGAPDPGASLELLLALPSFDAKKPREEFASHFRDLPPKNCVRCHLYAPGVAVRGVLEFLSAR